MVKKKRLNRFLGITAICLATCLLPPLRTRHVQAAAAAAEPHAAGHMIMTSLRPPKAGDEERAAAIVASARKVAERYVDYRKALADGYAIFMPQQQQKVYHFVLESADDEARHRFDPDRPPALLYEKSTSSTPGYKLVGVMYTDGFGASEEELDKRIPLSIAQWHEHVNLCVPPNPGQANWLLGDAKFGLSGSIVTEASCKAAGGRFRPHLSGWMTHVYPFEKDPAKVWQAGMGDDLDTMPGMTM